MVLTKGIVTILDVLVVFCLVITMIYDLTKEKDKSYSYIIFILLLIFGLNISLIWS